jgi:colanic acid/amylovoran biosynthesis glycosyltransferase
MRILVVASSFPSLNQPWLVTYIEQLIENNIQFSVLSFKNPADIDKKKFEIQYIFEHIIFLSNDTRAIISKLLHTGVNYKLVFLMHVFRCMYGILHLKLGWKAKLHMLITGSYLSSKLVTMGKYDLIHVHFDQDVGNIVPYSQFSKTPIVTTFHGLNPIGVSKLAIDYRKVVYKQVNNIFLNTNFAKQQVLDLGADKHKIIILPQGLRLEIFPFVAKMTPSKNGNLRILTVGRIQRDKGQVYALLALKRLRAHGRNVSWIFIGSGPDSEKLKHLTKKLGLDNYVQFMQNLETQQLIKIYQESHIFVLPSISNKHGYHIETQGVVLQEAQASGAITIGTKVGGIPECINDKIDGLLVEEKSSRSIYAAVTYLLENPETWQYLMENARRRVVEQFSSEFIGKEMTKYYQKILSELK